MLAYVFRHWPRLDVSLSEYEAGLSAFHQTLRWDSAVFRVSSAPWLPAGRVGYEDWYLLSGSAVIDALNEAAVAGECREPHDRVARQAQTGIGALYALVRGSLDLSSVSDAAWFGKPWGIGYEAFYARASPFLGQGALLRRQMVLGPPPEFGVLSPGPVALPEEFAVRRMKLGRIYPPL